MLIPEHISELIQSFLIGGLSDLEQKQLDEWILESQENTDAFAAFMV